MRYKGIQCNYNAGTYRCFSEGTLWKSGCLPFVFFTPPNRTWGNLTSFSHFYLRTYLEFRPPANRVILFYEHWQVCSGTGYKLVPLISLPSETVRVTWLPSATVCIIWLPSETVRYILLIVKNSGFRPLKKRTVDDGKLWCEGVGTHLDRQTVRIL